MCSGGFGLKSTYLAVVFHQFEEVTCTIHIINFCVPSRLSTREVIGPVASFKERFKFPATVIASDDAYTQGEQ